jgi:hypothetical protein
MSQSSIRVSHQVPWYNAGDSNPHLKGAVVGVQAALAAVDADVAAPLPPTSRYAACQRRTFHQNRHKELEGRGKIKGRH